MDNELVAHLFKLLIAEYTALFKFAHVVKDDGLIIPVRGLVIHKLSCDSFNILALGEILRHEHIRTDVPELLAAVDGLIDAERVEAVGTRDYHEVRVSARFERRLYLCAYLLDGHDLYPAHGAALLRHDLIFKVDTADACRLVFSYRAHDAAHIAVAGVCVTHQRNIEYLGKIAGARYHFRRGAETDIGNAEIACHSAVAAHVAYLEAVLLHQSCGQTVVAAGSDHDAGLAYKLTEPCILFYIHVITSLFICRCRHIQG